MTAKGPTTIDYVVVFVAELERSIEFYRDTIGLELKFSEHGYAEFATTNAKLALYESRRLSDLLGRDGARSEPKFEIVFLVESADARTSSLRDKDVAILAGPTDRPWGHRTVHVEDPDGNVIEFAEEIERLGQPP